jgi:hypothetical protein
VPASAALLPRELEALRRLAFPDVWFTRDDQAGGLSLPLRLRTDALRFSLAEPGFLHLGALTLETAEPPHRISEARAVHVDDMDARRNLHGLLAPGHPWISFHSTLAAPEMVIEFDPATLTRIGVDNRPDGHQERAWTLRIEARSPRHGTWHLIWQHGRREAAFLRAARHLGAAGLHPSATRLLRRATFQAMRLDPGLSHTLHRLGEEHGWNLALAAKRSLNGAVLAPRRRELSSHGIQRTFRFWSDAEQVAAVARLEGPRAALAAAGHEVFLGYGALLGFVRDGALIPHDDDLDLVVLQAEGQPEGVAAMAAILAAAGFETEAQTAFNLHVRRAGAPELICDLFLARRDGGVAVFHPAREARVPLAAIRPLRPTRMFGQPITVPADVFAVLEAFYGPGWREPDPDFVHAWDGAATP